MTPKRVRFVSDDAPSGTIPVDSRIAALWRQAVADRLKYEGDSNSLTGPLHSNYGRTLLAAMSVGHGRRLAVWWTFESDDVAIVLAMRVSDGADELDDEEPPVD